MEYKYRTGDEVYSCVNNRPFEPEFDQEGNNTNRCMIYSVFGVGKEPIYCVANTNLDIVAMQEKQLVTFNEYIDYHVKLCKKVLESNRKLLADYKLAKAKRAESEGKEK